jgi:murein DD-endopeptidase MepM/ murein hydrolase activator NlpD
VISSQGRRIALVFIAAGLLVGLLQPQAIAGQKARYREMQRRIEAARVRADRAAAREAQIRRRVHAWDNARLTLDRGLATLSDRLASHARRLALLKARVDRLKAQLELWTIQLQEAVERLGDQTKQIQKRAADIYIGAPNSYATVLLGYHDFSDFLSGFEFTQSVLRTDVQVLDAIEQARTRVTERRAIIAQKRGELTTLARVIRAEKKRVAAVRHARAVERDRVSRALNYRLRLLAEARNEKEAWLAAMRSYIRESDSIAAFIAGRQKGQSVVQGHGGYLRWPVSGTISSGYGWRMHPIYHRRSFHTGIDIAAPAGTTIRAARKGTVLWTGYRGAYGLIAIVDHGSSLATLYAHMSRVYVRPGERIGTLDSVGAIGCTGWCTGPHVHFEVRIQGSPTNPINWL